MGRCGAGWPHATTRPASRRRAGKRNVTVKSQRRQKKYIKLPYSFEEQVVFFVLIAGAGSVLAATVLVFALAVFDLHVPGM